MFIKSKYASNDTIFNIDFIIRIEPEEFVEPDKTHWVISIILLHGGNGFKWGYETKEQRDTEYSWILSQLDCRVNGEKKKKQTTSNAGNWGDGYAPEDYT